MGMPYEWIQSWRWAQEYFHNVRPQVHRQLGRWEQHARTIPNPELRSQALDSLIHKRFHCEGGGVFGGPSRDPRGAILPFLIPYQTLCDYLDTVTDRGPSQDPTNLRMLHQSLVDAVVPTQPVDNYYRWHPHQDDGAYIAQLVGACHQALSVFPGYAVVQPFMVRLVALYVDLQVFKHGPTPERVPRLTDWFHARQDPAWNLYWWEFAAATGSTLGLFALLTVALEPSPSRLEVEAVNHLYFPWMGALHILLDYFIDQAEDARGGDLNFVGYYASADQATNRLRWIYREVMQRSSLLPDRGFHRYVARGLLGFYLADRKVRQSSLSIPACQLLAVGGGISWGVWLAARYGRSP